MKATAAARFAALTLPASRNPGGLSVHQALSEADRQRARELHHEVYRRKGLLQGGPIPQALPHAYAPGSAIFVATEFDAVVGTIAFYMDSPAGLPMDEVHGEEVDRMRGRFARIAEVGGLAVLEDQRGIGITMMLYQATLRWAIAIDARCIVACVNPSSRRVYSKLLLFDALGPCKPHPRFRGAPSIPIALDLTTARARCRETHGSDLDHFLCEADLPYLKGSPEPA